MSFQDVISSSSSRFFEVYQFYTLAKGSGDGSSLHTSASTRIMRGVFFVHLYGAFEHTIVRGVQKTLELINLAHCPLKDVKPQFLSIALSANFDSASDVGRGKQWERRYELLMQMQSPDFVSVPTDLMPTDGRNFNFRQIQSIWRSFGIAGDILPRMSLRGTLDELVDNRNRIAHGNEAAADVGRRYTASDLHRIYQEVNEICTHVVFGLEEHIVSAGFRR